MTDISREEFSRLQDTLNDTNMELRLLQQREKTLNDKIDNLVTRPEFTPVKLIVYGMATTILSTVLLAILAKVIIQ